MPRSSVLLASLNARYIHKAPAVWMLREACIQQGIHAMAMEGDIARPPGALLRDILRQEAEYVGFSCSIWNIQLVERLTAALRRAKPELFIFWGGPEVSFDAKERMARLGENGPNAIICGEGEEALPDMLHRLLSGEGPEGTGIVTRSSDGGVAPPVKPDGWIHLYPPGALAELHRLHYVETSRGCPFACKYCLSSATQGVSALPAEQALRRLLSVRDAGAKVVKVLDRTFNFDAQRARHIWEGLIREGAGATYHFEIAAHLLGAEDIAVLQSAPDGLFQLEIGVQTTNQATLERIGRKQRWEHLANAVTALRERGNIHLHLDLIAGLPGDGYADVAEAVDRVLALRPHAIQLGFLKLLPGSPLKAEFDEMGWPYDPAPPYEVIATDAITHQELDRLHDVEDALSLFYNSGRMPKTAARYLRRFADYERVASDLRREGFFGQPRSPQATFDALWRVLPKEEEAVMLLTEDWLAMGKQLLRPWMRDTP